MNMEPESLSFEGNLEKNKKRKGPQRIYERITEEDFIKLLELCNERKLNKHKIILLLAYGAGLRLQEIINLQKDSFMLKERKIHIVQGKGSKDRYTIIPKQFRASYLDYIPFNITKMGIQKMFLKLTNDIKINKVIDTYETKSGKIKQIYKYHFHCLRHSFAHNCLAAGIPLNVLQEFLGHVDIATTGRYTKVTGHDAINIALNKGL